MNKKIITSTLLLSSIFGIVFAFQSPKWQLSSTQPSRAQSSSVAREIGTYASYGLDGTEEDLYAASDMVFVGQVLGFGSPSWDRDHDVSTRSLQEWEPEATPIHIYHQVEIRVLKPILGTKMGQIIHVNVLGSSPIAKMGPGSTWTMPNDGNLKVDSTGVFLVTTTGQSAWRSISGQTFMKTITTFSTGETETGRSYFPEKNGFYMEGNQAVTLEAIESKVRQYTPAREKYFRSLPRK